MSMPDQNPDSASSSVVPAVSLPVRATAWLRAFQPQPLAVDGRERWRATLGALVGILLMAWVSRWFSGSLELGPWLAAPLGASAVLVFAVPASPLAQPWSVVGGNTLSALVGAACAFAIPDQALAAATAVGLAIALMFALRCLHPPGGAVALTAVLGGAPVHELGYGFALVPVMANTAAMLLLAMLFNNAVGRRYPHQAQGRPHPHATRDPLPSARVGFTADDLDAALASFGEVLDIDREDLEEIMVRAQMHARRRHWGAVRCGYIMSRDVVKLSLITI